MRAHRGRSRGGQALYSKYRRKSIDGKLSTKESYHIQDVYSQTREQVIRQPNPSQRTLQICSVQNRHTIKNCKIRTELRRLLNFPLSLVPELTSVPSLREKKKSHITASTLKNGNVNFPKKILSRGGGRGGGTKCMF